MSLHDSIAGTPVARALVTARGGSGGAEVHGLTSASGRLTLRLPTAGRWEVTARRIGLAPRTGVVTLAGTHDTASLALVMRQARVVLPTTRVVADRGACQSAGDRVDRTSALWEQVTLALQSTLAGERERASTAPLRTVVHDRELDRAIRMVSEVPVRVTRGVGRPFTARHPDSLAVHGYVRSDAERTLEYLAPDENALLSAAFARTHCFDTPKTDASPYLAELRFRPAPTQFVPDIAGTAFVEPTSGALRRISFRYVNADSLFPSGTQHAGGDVHFDQMADGEWFVSAWSIRMPRMVRVAWARGPRLTGYHEVGGTVDTLASHPAVVTVHTGPRIREHSAPVPPTAAEARATSAPPTGDQAIVGGRLLVGTSGVARRARDWRGDFQNRRRLLRGVFFDSVTLARSNYRTATDALALVESVQWFTVPEGVPAPPRDEDPDLADAWTAGALLPVVTPADGGRRSAMCLVKLFLDGERSSAARLRLLPSAALAALEFYARPSDVPADFRRGGNVCGTALFWSGDRVSARP